MTVSPPPLSPQPKFAPGHASEGKPAAMVVWLLYVLALPSANLLAIAGMLIALSSRGGATGLPRQHIDRQIRLFWSAALLNLALTAACVSAIVGLVMATDKAAWLLPLAVITGLGLVASTLWFSIRSLIGLLNLSRDRAP